MNFIEKVYNSDNLKDVDMNEKTIRARAIIINSKNEVLMCYSNGLSHFEFPGGHLENDETLEECLKREILEETGISILSNEFIPFFSIKYYCKNYHESSKNRLVEIYYFIIHTDRTYDVCQMNLDIEEIKEKYECKYIPISNLEKILLENKNTTKENNTSLDDMLLVWGEFLKRNNK